MSGEQFPVIPELVGVAVNVKPMGLIADDVCPRRVTISGKDSFKYWSFPVAQAFTVPDTQVGRRSEPNEVKYEGAHVDGSVNDYGLDEFIPAKQDEEVPWSERARAVEWLTSLVLLQREKRVADALQTLTFYDADKRVTLSGTDQWTDKANSTPLDLLLEYLDKTLVPITDLTFGQASWRAFRTHPQIVSAIYPTGTGNGAVSRQSAADLLEVDRIHVGKSRVNTAKPGQTPSYSVCWGDSVIGSHQDPGADNQRGVTFAYTVTRSVNGQSRVAGEIPEPKRGLHGGTLVRAGESVVEVYPYASGGIFVQDTNA